MQRVVRFDHIQRDHRLLLLLWVLYYAWALVFLTIHLATSFNAVFTIADRRAVHLALVLSAALASLVVKRTWFERVLKVDGVILVVLLVLFALFALFAPLASFAPFASFAPNLSVLGVATLQSFLLIPIGISAGVFAGVLLIPYTFILNNTEKFYGILAGSALAACHAIVFQLGRLPAYLEVIGALIFLVVALVPLFLRGKAQIAPLVFQTPQTKARPVAFLTLFINLLFALAVFGVGKILLDSITWAAPFALYCWFFLGCLLACVVWLIVFAALIQSLQVTWSLCFAGFFIEVLLFVINNADLTLGIPFAVLVGLTSTLGFLNMYYNVGVLARKYNNMNYVRLPLWFGVGGASCFVIFAAVAANLTSQNLIIAVTIAAVVLVFCYFVAMPVLARSYFRDEWIADSELAEIDVEKYAVEIKQVAVAEALGLPELTPRERQIFTMLLTDAAPKQIAHDLKISTSTFNFHSANLYRKLEINSRIELITRFAK